jgi:hypothetical protein
VSISTGGGKSRELRAGLEKRNLLEKSSARQSRNVLFVAGFDHFMVEKTHRREDRGELC